MTSKSAVLEYLKQSYPQWVLGGKMNMLQVWDGNGGRATTGFRGDRNCRQLYQEGKLDKSYNDKGFAMYRWKPAKPIQTSIL